MENIFFVISAVYLVIINLLGFFVTLADKQKAKRKSWRIPEKAFFIIALLGGGAGVWGGMYLFRHKTRHWYFVLGIPAITILEWGIYIWYRIAGF